MRCLPHCLLCLLCMPALLAGQSDPLAGRQAEPTEPGSARPATQPAARPATQLATQTQPAGQSGESAARAGSTADGLPGPASLAELDAWLERACEHFDVPALGVAVLQDGRLAALATAGVRETGHPAGVGRQDPWHLGSCTKAMTATLCALLVEEGRLTWQSSVAEVLGPVVGDLRPAYGPVTLEQLLAHRSGLPDLSNPLMAGGLMLWMRTLSGEPTGQRRSVAQRILSTGPSSLAPATQPGSRLIYSNEGYLLAGLFCEMVTQTDYETLIRQRLFEPLGMADVGFGPPEQTWLPATQPATPAGHFRPPGAALQSTRTLPHRDNPPAFAPAGTAAAPLDQWARFAQLWLDLLSDAAPASALAAPARLPVNIDPVRRALASGRTEYALGWVVFTDASGRRCLSHSGSNTVWFCTALLIPEAQWAVLVTTNIGPPDGSRAVAGVVERLQTLAPAPSRGDRGSSQPVSP